MLPTSNMVKADSVQSNGTGNLLRAAKTGDVAKLVRLLDEVKVDISTANSSGLNCLHLAAKDGHLDIVKELIKRNINVNQATKRGNTALHIASLAGKLDIVEVLLKNNANPNLIAQNAFTPLYMAAQEGHENIVEYLLKNGANQSISTEDGFTPLAVALQEGKSKVVALLLDNDTKGRVKLPALHIAARKDDVKAAALLLQNDHSAEVSSKWIVNRTTESGFTALHIAAHYGNVGVASLLLNRGASHDLAAKNGITALHVASKRGHTRFCAMLIDRDADFNAQTKDGLTALHCAARSGHKPVVELLLDKMKTTDIARTKNGLSALHMAAQGGHLDVVRLLLDRGYPVDDTTLDYLTSLHIASHCGHEKIAQLLLIKQARVDMQAMNGFTPLHVACKKNQVRIAVLLLNKHANTEAVTESGLTPLHVACFMGHFEIIKILLEKGAYLETTNNRGEAALHMAVRSGRLSTVKYLLHHGARPDTRKKEWDGLYREESQTCLHLAARLNKLEIVKLLLEHHAVVDEVMQNGYTPLHVASQEGHVEICELLLDSGASVSLKTKSGFTSLHLASKYGRRAVANLLLKRSASPDSVGKDDLTPLHVSAHFDHQNIALLLLKSGASPLTPAKNAYTPLHIAAKKNQIDIAMTLMEYGASTGCKTRMGATPLHLAAQSGHTDMCSLLAARDANVNETARFELTPMHLAAEQDRTLVVKLLFDNGAVLDPISKTGYTPLHFASYHGNHKTVECLLLLGARVNAKTESGNTPLHLAAQQGHSKVVNLLLRHGASPNELTNTGHTALSLAKHLGYITVVDTLTTVTTETIETQVEKQPLNIPETLNEEFMSEASDEDDSINVGDNEYLSGKELQELGDDSIIATNAGMLLAKGKITELESAGDKKRHSWTSSVSESDNCSMISRKSSGFLVSFMVDARGGSMRGTRYPDLRVFVPPNSCNGPTRITCRLAREEKFSSSKDPTAGELPLGEDEGESSRILELGGKGKSFLEPIAIEIPHFASLRGGEREIVIIRSDDGDMWKEHKQSCSDADFLKQADAIDLETQNELAKRRIVRVITKDLPKYFALYSRTKEHFCQVGPPGGVLESEIFKHASATFPENALTKVIKVGIQVMPITADLCKRAVGNRAKASSIVTVEPRRRKFHKAITLAIQYPEGGNMKDFISTSEESSLRLLCSISGRTDPAEWEDITGSTPLNFHEKHVSFTTTVSAKFWLLNCYPNADSVAIAEKIYQEALLVPYMAKFVVLGKAQDSSQTNLRVFCIVDEKSERTLENQERFVEIARSRDIEVLKGSSIYVECTGNLVTTKQAQPHCTFIPLSENRIHFSVKVRDMMQEPTGRLTFYRDEKGTKVHGARKPVCSLNITLPVAVKVTETSNESHDLNSALVIARAKKRYCLVDPDSVSDLEPQLDDSSRESGLSAVDVAEVMGKLTAVQQILDLRSENVVDSVSLNTSVPPSSSASFHETTQVVAEMKSSLNQVKNLLEEGENILEDEKTGRMLKLTSALNNCDKSEMAACNMDNNEQLEQNVTEMQEFAFKVKLLEPSHEINSKVQDAKRATDQLAGFLSKDLDQSRQLPEFSCQSVIDNTMPCNEHIKSPTSISQTFTKKYTNDGKLSDFLATDLVSCSMSESSQPTVDKRTLKQHENNASIKEFRKNFQINKKVDVLDGSGRHIISVRSAKKSPTLECLGSQWSVHDRAKAFEVVNKNVSSEVIKPQVTSLESEMRYQMEALRNICNEESLEKDSEVTINDVNVTSGSPAMIQPFASKSFSKEVLYGVSESVPMETGCSQKTSMCIADNKPHATILKSKDSNSEDSCRHERKQEKDWLDCLEGTVQDAVETELSSTAGQQLQSLLRGQTTTEKDDIQKCTAVQQFQGLDEHVSRSSKTISGTSKQSLGSVSSNEVSTEQLDISSVPMDDSMPDRDEVIENRELSFNDVLNQWIKFSEETSDDSLKSRAASASVNQPSTSMITTCGVGTDCSDKATSQGAKDCTDQDVGSPVKLDVGVLLHDKLNMSVATSDDAKQGNNGHLDNERVLQMDGNDRTQMPLTSQGHSTESRNQSSDHVTTADCVRHGDDDSLEETYIIESSKEICSDVLEEHNPDELQTDQAAVSVNRSQTVLFGHKKSDSSENAFYVGSASGSAFGALTISADKNEQTNIAASQTAAAESNLPNYSGTCQEEQIKQSQKRTSVDAGMKFDRNDLLAQETTIPVTMEGHAVLSNYAVSQGIHKSSLDTKDVVGASAVLAKESNVLTAKQDYMTKIDKKFSNFAEEASGNVLYKCESGNLLVGGSNILVSTKDEMRSNDGGKDSTAGNDKPQKETEGKFSKTLATSLTTREEPVSQPSNVMSSTICTILDCDWDFQEQAVAEFQETTSANALCESHQNEVLVTQEVIPNIAGDQDIPVSVIINQGIQNTFGQVSRDTKMIGTTELLVEESVISKYVASQSFVTCQGISKPSAGNISEQNNSSGEKSNIPIAKAEVQSACSLQSENVRIYEPIAISLSTQEGQMEQPMMTDVILPDCDNTLAQGLHTPRSLENVLSDVANMPGFNVLADDQATIASVSSSIEVQHRSTSENDTVKEVKQVDWSSAAIGAKDNAQFHQARETQSLEISEPRGLTERDGSESLAVLPATTVAQVKQADHASDSMATSARIPGTTDCRMAYRSIFHRETRKSPEKMVHAAKEMLGTSVIPTDISAFSKTSGDHASVTDQSMNDDILIGDSNDMQSGFERHAEKMGGSELNEVATDNVCENFGASPAPQKQYFNETGDFMTTMTGSMLQDCERSDNIHQESAEIYLENTSDNALESLNRNELLVSQEISKVSGDPVMPHYAVEDESIQTSSGRISFDENISDTNDLQVGGATREVEHMAVMHQECLETANEISHDPLTKFEQTELSANISNIPLATRDETQSSSDMRSPSMEIYKPLKLTGSECSEALATSCVAWEKGTYQTNSPSIVTDATLTDCDGTFLGLRAMQSLENASISDHEILGRDETVSTSIETHQGDTTREDITDKLEQVDWLNVHSKARDNERYDDDRNIESRQISEPSELMAHDASVACTMLSQEEQTSQSSEQGNMVEAMVQSSVSNVREHELRKSIEKISTNAQDMLSLSKLPVDQATFSTASVHSIPFSAFTDHEASKSAEKATDDSKDMPDITELTTGDAATSRIPEDREMSITAASYQPIEDRRGYMQAGCDSKSVGVSEPLTLTAGYVLKTFDGLLDVQEQQVNESSNFMTTVVADAQVLECDHDFKEKLGLNELPAHQTAIPPSARIHSMLSFSAATVEETTKLHVKAVVSSPKKCDDDEQPHGHTIIQMVTEDHTRPIDAAQSLLDQKNLMSSELTSGSTTEYSSSATLSSNRANTPTQESDHAIPFTVMVEREFHQSENYADDAVEKLYLDESNIAAIRGGIQVDCNEDRGNRQISELLEQTTHIPKTTDTLCTTWQKSSTPSAIGDDILFEGDCNLHGNQTSLSSDIVTDKAIAMPEAEGVAIPSNITVNKKDNSHSDCDDYFGNSSSISSVKVAPNNALKMPIASPTAWQEPEIKLISSATMKSGNPLDCSDGIHYQGSSKSPDKTLHDSLEVLCPDKLSFAQQAANQAVNTTVDEEMKDSANKDIKRILHVSLTSKESSIEKGQDVYSDFPTNGCRVEILDKDMQDQSESSEQSINQSYLHSETKDSSYLYDTVESKEQMPPQKMNSADSLVADSIQCAMSPDPYVEMSTSTLKGFVFMPEETSEDLCPSALQHADDHSQPPLIANSCSNQSIIVPEVLDEKFSYRHENLPEVKSSLDSLQEISTTRESVIDHRKLPGVSNPENRGLGNLNMKDNVAVVKGKYTSPEFTDATQAFLSSTSINKNITVITTGHKIKNHSGYSPDTTEMTESRSQEMLHDSTKELGVKETSEHCYGISSEVTSSAVDSSMQKCSQMDEFVVTSPINASLAFDLESDIVFQPSCHGNANYERKKEIECQDVVKNENCEVQATVKESFKDTVPSKAEDIIPSNSQVVVLQSVGSQSMIHCSEGTNRNDGLSISVTKLNSKSLSPMSGAGEGCIQTLSSTRSTPEMEFHQSTTVSLQNMCLDTDSRTISASENNDQVQSEIYQILSSKTDIPKDDHKNSSKSSVTVKQSLIHDQHKCNSSSDYNSMMSACTDLEPSGSDGDAAAASVPKCFTTNSVSDIIVCGDEDICDSNLNDQELESRSQQYSSVETAKEKSFDDADMSYADLLTPIEPEINAKKCYTRISHRQKALGDYVHGTEDADPGMHWKLTALDDSYDVLWHAAQQNQLKGRTTKETAISSIEEELAKIFGKKASNIESTTEHCSVESTFVHPRSGIIPQPSSTLVEACLAQSTDGVARASTSSVTRMDREVNCYAIPLQNLTCEMKSENSNKVEKLLTKSMEENSRTGVFVTSPLHLESSPHTSPNLAFRDLSLDSQEHDVNFCTPNPPEMVKQSFTVTEEDSVNTKTIGLSSGCDASTIVHDDFSVEVTSSRLDTKGQLVTCDAFNIDAEHQNVYQDDSTCSATSSDYGELDLTERYSFSEEISFHPLGSNSSLTFAPNTLEQVANSVNISDQLAAFENQHEERQGLGFFHPHSNDDNIPVSQATVTSQSVLDQSYTPSDVPEGHRTGDFMKQFPCENSSQITTCGVTSSGVAMQKVTDLEHDGTLPCNDSCAKEGDYQENPGDLALQSMSATSVGVRNMSFIKADHQQGLVVKPIDSMPLWVERKSNDHGKESKEEDCPSDLQCSTQSQEYDDFSVEFRGGMDRSYTQVCDNLPKQSAIWKVESGNASASFEFLLEADDECESESKPFLIHSSSASDTEKKYVVDERFNVDSSVVYGAKCGIEEANLYGKYAEVEENSTVYGTSDKSFDLDEGSRNSETVVNIIEDPRTISENYGSKPNSSVGVDEMEEYLLQSLSSSHTVTMTQRTSSISVIPSENTIILFDDGVGFESTASDSSSICEDEEVAEVVPASEVASGSMLDHVLMCNDNVNSHITYDGSMAGDSVENEKVYQLPRSGDMQSVSLNSLGMQMSGLQHSVESQMSSAMKVTFDFDECMRSQFSPVQNAELRSAAEIGDLHCNVPSAYPACVQLRLESNATDMIRERQKDLPVFVTSMSDSSSFGMASEQTKITWSSSVTSKTSSHLYKSEHLLADTHHDGQLSMPQVTQRFVESGKKFNEEISQRVHSSNKNSYEIEVACSSMSQSSFFSDDFNQQTYANASEYSDFQRLQYAAVEEASITSSSEGANEQLNHASLRDKQAVQGPVAEEYVQGIELKPKRTMNTGGAAVTLVYSQLDSIPSATRAFKEYETYLSTACTSSLNSSYISSSHCAVSSTEKYAEAEADCPGFASYHSFKAKWDSISPVQHGKQDPNGSYCTASLDSDASYQIISSQLGLQWMELARELNVSEQDVWEIQKECDGEFGEKGFCVLSLWHETNKENPNREMHLKDALERIGREDLVKYLKSQNPLLQSPQFKNDESGFRDLAEDIGTPRSTPYHVSTPYPFRSESMDQEKVQIEEEPVPLCSAENDDEDDPNKPHFTYPGDGDAPSIMLHDSDVVFKSDGELADINGLIEQEVRQNLEKSRVTNGDTYTGETSGQEENRCVGNVPTVDSVTVTTIERSFIVEVDDPCEIQIPEVMLTVNDDDDGEIVVTRRVYAQDGLQTPE